MEIYLSPVQPSERDTLFMLNQYALFDESHTDNNEMHEGGLFHYPGFERYMSDPLWQAFFIREKGTEKILGIAQIHAEVEHAAEGHYLAQFMVMPKYRKCGIGRKAAQLCLDMYDGYWEIHPSSGSGRTFSFWQMMVRGVCGENYRFINGVFCFEK